MIRRWCQRFVLSAALLWTLGAAAADWTTALEQRLSEIDQATPGQMGVFVRELGSSRTLRYHADRPWYLASTIKVPVAIAVLQGVEAGNLSLDDALVLKDSDYVDGAGTLLWTDPGARFTIRELLEHSLTNSDSTATDMLIRHIGADVLQQRVAHMVDEGFDPITTILQVRYDAYGQVHAGAAELSNMDYVRLKSVPEARRFQAFVDKLGVAAADLPVDSIDAAFDRYYAVGGRNTSTMTAFGRLLERLAGGELLSPKHTDLLLGLMQRITTGDERIKAGLPEGVAFAQKTGTQVDRACNVGIVHPESDAPIVVAACLEEFGETEVAEAALRKLGAALVESGVVASEP